MTKETDYFKSKLAIAKALGVHRHTIDLWEQKTWFPKRGQHGWLKTEMMDVVDQYVLKKEGVADDVSPGSREEKTALECQRLKIVIEKERELLEQAKEDTRQMIEEGRRKSRKLIEKKEVEEGLTEFLSSLRNTIQSWAKTAQADNPEHHTVFDKAVKLYLDEVQRIGGDVVK